MHSKPTLRPNMVGPEITDASTNYRSGLSSSSSFPRAPMEASLSRWRAGGRIRGGSSLAPRSLMWCHITALCVSLTHSPHCGGGVRNQGPHRSLCRPRFGNTHAYKNDGPGPHNPSKGCGRPCSPSGMTSGHLIQVHCELGTVHTRMKYLYYPFPRASPVCCNPSICIAVPVRAVPVS